MQTAFLCFLFILGACFGSFLCCQARRLHQKGKLGPHSVCLHCKTRLKWYDNIPIISWLILRGKCRKCHRKIGLAEFIAELGTAFAFLVLGTTVNIESIGTFPWAMFVAVLMLTTVLIFLAIYDGLYGELPTLFLIVAIVLGFVVLIFKISILLFATPFSPDLVWRPFVSIAILGGLYLILYLVSKGKWVGDGDWLLGTAIALALFDPWLALVALFIANCLACIIMAPTAIKRKQSKIYFGPFLVIAFVIVYSLSDFLQSML